MLYTDRKRRPEPNLVAKVENQEDRKGNVRGKEVRNGPPALGEDLKAVGEGEERNHTKDGISKVWLERSLVRQLGKHVVVGHGFAEADVCDHDNDPGDETGDGGDVGEPSENLRSGARHVEVGEESDCPCCQNSSPWYAFLRRLAEELGRFAVKSHSVKDTGAREQKGVSGAPR